MQLIIWSCDRACQVDALLESIQVFAKDIFQTELIYSCSNEEYRSGYKKLFLDWPKLFGFEKKQGNGKKLLLDCINSSSSKQICFTTDDTIIHSSILVDPSIFMDDCDIFSLRLGLNTIVQNHVTGECQPILRDYAIITPINNEKWSVLSWNFTKYNPLHNYGYPFGLDMHCYNKSMLVPILESIAFDKPNELETPLFYKKHLINPRMKCFEHSCAVNVPITNMSTITQSEGMSLEYLNQQYLSGKKLRYKPTNIVGCHQVLEYEFI